MTWAPGFFNRQRKLILIDLIFASTGIFLDVDEVTFGAASALDAVPNDDTDENTFIEITMENGRDDRFQGQNGLLYRRVRFSEVGINTFAGSVSFPTTIYSLLPLLSSKFGVLVTKEDVEDRAYNSSVDYITLKAKPGSNLFFGSSRVYIKDLMFRNFDLPGFMEYKPLLVA